MSAPRSCASINRENIALALLQNLISTHPSPERIGLSKPTYLSTTLTIDREAPNWDHKVGMIPSVLKKMAPSPENAVAVLCGPPIMIKFTLAAFRELGFKDENIYTTLERRMKCGIGICGRCNLGSKFVCLDGPVFTQAQLNMLPPEM